MQQSYSENQLIQSQTVQDYIDETPYWPDGTQASAAPMTAMQWRIWGLATAGKFFEGLVVFMTGVALPLMVKEYNLVAAEKGALGAAPLFGILIGASALGSLSDIFGRKKMFITEMILFLICLVFLVFSPGFGWIIVFLFGMGLALGCDYPTAHLIISESIPSSKRGTLVLGAFSFQAVGALAGTAVGYLILYENPEIGAWRWMYAASVLPALLVCLGRFFIPDSPHWLMSRGRVEEAEREALRLLRRKPPYPKSVKLSPPAQNAESPSGSESSKGYLQLFRGKQRRATILASVPWFLQDLATYGIGLFTPTILASAVGAETEHVRNVAALIHNDMLAAKGAAFIDILLLVGIIAAVFLADRVGRIRLQIIGFIGCAMGLFLASLSTSVEGSTKLFLLFAGFMLFNFMTNLGPNAMTYLIAGEVFPTRLRGTGAGFAASFAKVGAVTTAFLFPILLKGIGTTALLYALIGASLVGAVTTWFFRIETKGIKMEDIE